MSLVWADRVLETTTTIGTGALTLAGAVTGYQTFAVVGDGNTCYYCVYAVDSSGNPSGVWEVGLGTYTASGTTLARTTVYANSSGTQVALDLAAGTKRVMLTAAAQHLTTIPVANGGTGLTALGSALQVLRTNAGATAAEWATISTGLTVGTTAITSGTSGRLLYDAAGTLGETAAVTYATTTANLTVTASGAAVAPLVVKGAGSQSANLLECQDNTGAVAAKVGPTGALTLNAASTHEGTPVLSIQGTPAGFGLRVYRGAANFEVQNTGSITYIGTSSAHQIVWITNNENRMFMYAGGGIKVGVTASVAYRADFEVEVGTNWRTGIASSGVISPVEPLYSGRLMSSVESRVVFGLMATWADSTDATRKGRLSLNVYDTAVRECLRLEASGSAPMLGLYGTAAVAQYATTGTVTGYTGGGGTALTHSDTFTGNTGSTAYTIGDVVRALKLLGAIAA